MTQPGIAVGAAGGPLLVRVQRLLGVATSRHGRCRRCGSPPPQLVMIVALMFTGPICAEPTPGTLAPAADRKRGQFCADASWTPGPDKPVAGASVRAQYITGVENPTKCPIGDCEDVTDRAAGRIPIYRVTADADGRFDIRGMKPGDYLVAAVGARLRSALFRTDVGDMPEMPVHVAAGERRRHRSTSGSCRQALSAAASSRTRARDFRESKWNCCAAPICPEARNRLPSPSRKRRNGARSVSATSRPASTTSARTRHHRSCRHVRTRPCHMWRRSSPNDRHRVRAASRPRQRPGACRRGFRADDCEDARGERPAGRPGGASLASVQPFS